MKLTSQNYNSPILTEGQFENVFIEETAITLKRKDSYLRIDFEMYIEREGQIVVLFNGFHKKTQKTPSSEIDKALKIKEEYYEYKKQHAD